MVSIIPVNPETTANSVADLVSELSRRMRRQVMVTLDVPGLTPGRMRALRALLHAESPMRIGELATRLSMAPRSATTVIDDLAEMGLVQRVLDPDDRRATLIQVTDDGERLHADAETARRRVAEEILRALSHSELETLHDLLNRVTATPPRG